MWVSDTRYESKRLWVCENVKRDTRYKKCKSTLTCRAVEVGGYTHTIYGYVNTSLHIYIYIYISLSLFMYIYIHIYILIYWFICTIQIGAPKAGHEHIYLRHFLIRTAAPNPGVAVSSVRPFRYVALTALEVSHCNVAEYGGNNPSASLHCYSKADSTTIKNPNEMRGITIDIQNTRKYRKRAKCEHMKLW